MKDRFGILTRPLAGSLFALIAAVYVAADIEPVCADVFSVSHVKVDETAKDAASAKVKAIGAAQVIAFRRLIQRIAPSGSFESLPQFGVNDVSAMTSGLTFEEERTGPTRYIATLTVSFLPDTVRELLYQYNVPIAEEQASQILLVPVWKSASGPGVVGRGKPLERGLADTRPGTQPDAHPGANWRPHGHFGDHS